MKRKQSSNKHSRRAMVRNAFFIALFLFSASALCASNYHLFTEQVDEVEQLCNIDIDLKGDLGGDSDSERSKPRASEQQAQVQAMSTEMPSVLAVLKVGRIQLYFSGDYGMSDIIVTNANGATVCQENVNTASQFSSRIDISHLTSGTYTIKIQSQLTGGVVEGSFVIE